MNQETTKLQETNNYNDKHLFDSEAVKEAAPVVPLAESSSDEYVATHQPKVNLHGGLRRKNNRLPIALTALLIIGAVAAISLISYQSNRFTANDVDTAAGEPFDKALFLETEKTIPAVETAAKKTLPKPSKVQPKPIKISQPDEVVFERERYVDVEKLEKKIRKEMEKRRGGDNHKKRGKDKKRKKHGKNKNDD